MRGLHVKESHINWSTRSSDNTWNQMKAKVSTVLHVLFSTVYQSYPPLTAEFQLCYFYPNAELIEMTF